MVTFELWHGVVKSSRARTSTDPGWRCSSPVPLELVGFDDEGARHTGHLRAALESTGTPIGAYDVLIVGQARRHGTTLVP